jgi:hypothetical protein
MISVKSESASMEKVPAKWTVEEVLAEGGGVIDLAESVFGGLSAAQINWKPSPESWSVGQCFDHLITANQGYFPQLDHVIKRERRTTLWQRMPILPGFFGKLVVGAVSPQAERKLKAPKLFQPSSSEIDSAIVARFVDQQRDLLERMSATAGMDLERIIIYSPVTNFVIYSLLDAYRLIVAHELRHFGQARRVLQSTGFPSS